MINPVKLGDSITLYCGDCLEILPTLGKVDAVVTDPPYGIGGYVAHPSKLRRILGHKGENWDQQTADISFIVEHYARIIMWGGNNYTLPISRGWLAWFKPDAPPSMAQIELAWTNLNMNARIISQTIADTNKERLGHPTQKPLRVMEWTLSFLPQSDTIIDPFMGSGTTGVACANLGKKFVGIERERKYFDIACERIARAQAQGQLFPPETKPAAVQEALI